MQAIPSELIALAFAVDAFAEKGDVIDGLLPMFGPVLSRVAAASSASAMAGNLSETLGSGEPVAIERKDFSRKFSEQIHSYYGIPMNPLVADSLVKKLVSAKMLALEDSRLTIIHSNGNGNNQLIPNEVENLLDEFVDFVRQKYPTTDEIAKMSDKDLKTACMERMKTEDILRATDVSGGKKNPALEMEDLEQQIDDLRPSNKRMFDILWVWYIEFLRDGFPEKHAVLMKVVRGILIAEVIFSIQKPGSKDLLRNVSVVIDAPLLLDALGLGSPEYHGYAKDLFEMMHLGGVQMRVFDHSLIEMENVIRTTMSAVRRGEGFGPLAERLQGNTVEQGRALIVQNNAREAVEDRLKVKVIESDEHDIEEYHQYCHPDIMGPLRYDIGGLNVSPTFDKRDMDAKSVVATLRLRRGISSASMVDAGWFFVTKNEPLAKNANRFLRGKKLIKPGHVPPVVTAREMAGYIWFSAGIPADKIRKIAESDLIARCSAVLEPGQDIRTNLRTVLQHLDDPQMREEYISMLGDKRARVCLMVETMGNPAAIVPGNVMELGEKMRQSIIEKAVAQKASEIEAQKVSEILRERGQMEKERSEFQQQLDDYARKTSDLHEKVDMAVRDKEKAESVAQSAEQQVAEIKCLRESEKRERDNQLIKVLESESNRIFARLRAGGAVAVGLIGGGMVAGCISLFSEWGMAASLLSGGVGCLPFWVIGRLFSGAFSKSIVLKQVYNKSRVLGLGLKDGEVHFDDQMSQFVIVERDK